MQDPNADTEWNAILRSKGILPPKEEKGITEEDIINMVENTIEQKSKGQNFEELSVDELDELEDDIDEEDERVFEEYRRKRVAELTQAQQLSRFGSVTEITKADWVTEVNKAGDGVWVIVHVYKPAVPECKLMCNHMENLAQKFPQTKFLKGVSNLCIPNYPDKNLPTVFVYFEGDLKKQWIGSLAFGGMNLKLTDLEWMLAQVGAVKSDLEEKPRPQIQDVMTSAIRQSNINEDSDDD